MLKTVRKAFLLGLGAAALTKESAEKFVNELVKRGEISSRDGKALVKKMTRDAELRRKRLQPIIERETMETLKRLSNISKTEAKILAERIARIEKEIRKKPKAGKAIKKRVGKRKKKSRRSR